MKNALLVLSLAFLAACASNKTAAPAKADAKADANAAAPANAETKAETKTAPPATKASGDTDSKIECSAGDDKRTIEVVKVAPSGCELLYTKFGNTEKKGESAASVEFCTELAGRIRSNLEGAGFKCM